MVDSDSAEFTVDERDKLIDWFKGYAVSRFWFRMDADGLNLMGFLTNTSYAIEAIEIRLERRRLNDVSWHVQHGLLDPRNDPNPEEFRVLRWWPGIVNYGFSAHIPFDWLRQVGQKRQRVRVDITDKKGNLVCDSVQSVHLPVEDLIGELRVTLPPKYLIHRVMGVSEEAEWILSGCTNVGVISEVLRDVVGKKLASMGRVLEWGSGCGRLSRHLVREGLDLTGIDIDGGAVAWCNKHIAQGTKKARFLTCGLEPPTELPDGSFGLAIGISVITHLDDASGKAWLAELARLLQPGGILLLTTHGLDTFSVVNDARIYRAIQNDGICSLQSRHLDSLLGEDQEYYRETWHSWPYIRKNWAEWFEVLDIRRGGHFGYQDLVVMKRR